MVLSCSKANSVTLFGQGTRSENLTYPLERFSPEDVLGSYSETPFTSMCCLHRLEEPDEKKMLTDDPTLASAQMMDGDMQVNQAAYNYNAWYQVGSARLRR